METGEKKLRDPRQTLVFLLGASFMIFLGLFLWRLEVGRRYEEERVKDSAALELRQDKLEERLARIEASSLKDRTVLEEKILDLTNRQEDAAATPGSGRTVSDFNTEGVMKSVVELVCIDNVNKDVYYTGSGTVVDRNGTIVTNQHILRSDDGSVIRFCGIGFTVDLHDPPRIEFVAASRAVHTTTDLAILQIIGRLDDQALPEEFPAVAMEQAADSSRDLTLGDVIYIGGYPGIGADTFSFTEGVVSGRVGMDLIKTSALIDSGASGGAAFDSSGQYVGVPTAAVRGDIGGSMGYLISAEVVDRFLADYYSNRNLLPADEAE